MSNAPQAVFGCTALVGTNKVGRIKPDADGYYTLCVGGFNAYNSIGEYYPLGPVESMFRESSILMRRIKKGNCKGEMGHPVREKNWSISDFIQRILRIDERYICVHYRKVWNETQGVKDDKGRPIVATMAELKPSGPMGDSLRESLDNPHENVCFSIRTIMNRKMDARGVVNRIVKNIVGWDVVTEAGIDPANKYAAPGLESLVEQAFTREQFEDVDMSTPGIALESSDIIDLRQSLEWDTLSTPARVAIQKPASADW